MNKTYYYPEYHVIHQGKLSRILEQFPSENHEGSFQQEHIPKTGEFLTVDGCTYQIIAIEIEYKTECYPKVYLKPFPNFIEYLESLA